MSLTSLEIVQPDSVALAFGERTTLVVRLLGATGQPIAGASVDFAIAVDRPTESAGGSTLSVARASTDSLGKARVDVVAGGSLAFFRVTAEAAGALPVAWTLYVSDLGSAALDVIPRHIGVRDDGGAIEVRLYRGATRCSELSLPTPPPGSYPARSVADFGGVAGFDNLVPEEGFAVLGWTATGAGVPTASGCVDLAPRQLRPGGRVRLELPIVDRPLAPAASYLVSSTFDLAPLRARVFAAGAPWARAMCPRGAAELLLDCAIDALDGTGDLDCVVEAPGALAVALEARRGAALAGCRPAVAGSDPSLDELVMSTLSQLPGAAASLAPAASALADVLDSLGLESMLVLGGRVAAHTLSRVTLETGGVLHHSDLTATARPLLAATAAFRRGVDSDEIDLEILPYTLRLGSLAAAALRDSGALAGDVDLGALGEAIVTPGGCAAVSAAACGAIARPASCLLAACLTALPALDEELGGTFTLLDGSGIDFMIEGGGVLMDVDGDLTAEQVRGGTWTATARLADGDEVSISGAFQAGKP